MRERDLSSILVFRSPSVSKEQEPPAARLTPTSTSPWTPILNYLMEANGGGFVASSSRNDWRQKKVLTLLPFEKPGFIRDCPASHLGWAQWEKPDQRK